MQIFCNHNGHTEKSEVSTPIATLLLFSETDSHTSYFSWRCSQTPHICGFCSLFYVSLSFHWVPIFGLNAKLFLDFFFFPLKNVYHYFSWNLLMNYHFLLTLCNDWIMTVNCGSCVFYVLYAWSSQRIIGSDFLHTLFILTVLIGLFDSAFFSHVTEYHWNKNFSFWFLMLLCYQAGQKCSRP